MRGERLKAIQPTTILPFSLRQCNISKDTHPYPMVPVLLTGSINVTPLFTSSKLSYEL